MNDSSAAEQGYLGLVRLMVNDSRIRLKQKDVVKFYKALANKNSEAVDIICSRYPDFFEKNPEYNDQDEETTQTRSEAQS